MKKALVVLMSLTALGTYAQEDEQVVIVRQSTGTKARRAPKPERNVENYNAFKFDPFRMAIGEINFSWEHRIHEKTTLEVELGPTVSNLGRNRFYTQPAEPGMGTYRRNSSMGVLVSAAVRYYPLEDFHAMNKLYVSPRFKYRRYNEFSSSDEPSLSDIRGYSDEFIFSFNVGYQAWLSNNFAFDYYIGAGIGSYNGKTYQPLSTYDGNTDTWSYTWQPITSRYARFVGVIGMKVTIGN